MSDVASLELSKELYELSGWDNTLPGAKDRWVKLPDNSWESLNMHDLEANGLDKKLWFKGIPAYDLGYLLRKLPEEIKSRILVMAKQYDKFHFGYAERDNYGRYTLDDYYYKHSVYANTPEDAACKLAIELFKQGVLQP